MTKIRTMTAGDAEDVRTIYQAGIDTGQATFETQAPDWTAFDQGKMAAPRLVSVDEDGSVTGWAVLSPTSSRCVYGGVAEITIYVAASARGKGVGTMLIEAMVEASEAEGIWTLVAGIFPENEGSVALHQKAGFDILGRRKRIGKMRHGPMAGQWRDILWLERRSSRVGID